jgi:hypothetical protein
MMPIVGLGLMNAFPGAMIYSTSGSDRQVKEQLFEQQLRPRVESKSWKDAGWKIKTGDSLKVTAPNGSSWLGYVCANDQTAEGFHGYWRDDEEAGEKRYCPCIYMVDEGKSVGDGVFEAIGRIDPDFWLSVSTPGKESGWFYEGISPDTLKAGIAPTNGDTTCSDKVEWSILNKTYTPNKQHDYQVEWADVDDEHNTEMFTYRRMVGWENCPHLHTEKKKIARLKILRKYGKNSAYVKSMLYGQFQRSEDFSLIYTDEDLALMRRAMRGEFTPIGSDIRAASDTSDAGKDKKPLFIRVGTEVVHQDHFEGDGLEHAEHLSATLKELKIPPWQFIIDGGGVGAIIASYMEKQFDYCGVKRAMANTGPRFKFQYRDKYTEAHFLLKELLSAGVLRLDKNDALLKQMRSRRFIEMEAGLKIKCEPKPAHRKREKGSPDDLDTLIYLLYDFDWSLLANYTQSPGPEINKNAMTKMEKDAHLGAVGGGSRPFGGMRSAAPMRARIMADRRLQGLRIGR